MHLDCCRKCTEMRQCHAHISLSGTSGSMRDAKIWKMTLGVEGLQQAGLQTMLSMQEADGACDDCWLTV